MSTTTPPHSLRTSPEPDPVPDRPRGAPPLDGTAAGQPLRRDGDLLLSGRAEFLDDISPTGLVHAAILRSPHPHARILSVDTSAAEALPGVRAVLTGEQAVDLATPMPAFFDPAIVGCRTAEFRCLAVDTVRWVGQPVAAVAAESLADAEAARDAIVVDWEILPAVLDAERALEPDAPVLFEEWGDNVLGRFPFAEGDAATKIAAAPHVVSGELRVGRHHSAPMETRGYIASWDRGGRLTVWATTQNPHPLRTNLSTTLGLAEDRIRVIAHPAGRRVRAQVQWLRRGAAGLPAEPARRRAGEVAGDPAGLPTRGRAGVRAPLQRRLRRRRCGARPHRPHGRQHRRTGDLGRLEHDLPGRMTFPGPYRVSDYDVESIPVVTNKAPWNGYRGYGKEQAALVLERMMDLIAVELGFDPAEVRRRNFVPPEAFPHWTAAKHLDSGNYVGALDKVLALCDYLELRARQATGRESGRYVGIGVAFELTPEGGDFAGSFVRRASTPPRCGSTRPAP